MVGAHSCGYALLRAGSLGPPARPQAWWRVRTWLRGLLARWLLLPSAVPGFYSDRATWQNACSAMLTAARVARPRRTMRPANPSHSCSARRHPLTADTETSRVCDTKVAPVGR